MTTRQKAAVQHPPWCCHPLYLPSCEGPCLAVTELDLHNHGAKLLLSYFWNIFCIWRLIKFCYMLRQSGHCTKGRNRRPAHDPTNPVQKMRHLSGWSQLRPLSFLDFLLKAFKNKQKKVLLKDAGLTEHSSWSIQDAKTLATEYHGGSAYFESVIEFIFVFLQCGLTSTSSSLS